MADSMSEVPVVNTTLNETAGNATAKIPSTPEGMAIAYGSLLLMAVLPIFFGSFRSVRYHKAQKVCNTFHEHVDAIILPAVTLYCMNLD